LKVPAKDVIIARKYKILGRIGEGGMGIVYKAEDTKLKRTVALKFLSPELTKDRLAKARFVQEAQAAAALDHPNICAVFEISEADGATYIVMPYVRGQSLKEKIATRKRLWTLPARLPKASEKPTSEASSTGTLSRRIS
jgi:serine/threonine protein kinase